MYSSEYRYAIKNESKDLQLKNNLFINNVIKDSIIINDNSIILHIDNIPNGLLDEIDDVTLSIYTELTVTSNNADSVENNTYTWNLDKNNYLNKKISLYIERPQAGKDQEGKGYDPRKLLKPGADAITALCKEMMENFFGSAGKAE